MTTQNPFGLGLETLRTFQDISGEQQRQNILRQQQELQQQQALQQEQSLQQQQSFAEEQQQQLMMLANQYNESRDPAILREMIVLNPDYTANIQKQFGLLNEESKSRAINEASGLAQMLKSNPDQAVQFWRDNLSQKPEFSGLSDNFEQGDIEGALNEIGFGITAVGGKEAYEKAFVQPEQTNFIKELVAAGIEPGTDEFKRSVQERYGKGATIAFDVREVLNPETNEVELARINRTPSGQNIEFLGVKPAPKEEVQKGFSFYKTGKIDSMEEARTIIRDANSSQLGNAGYAMRLDEAGKDLNRLSGEIDPTDRAIRAALTPSGEGISGFFGSMTDEMAKSLLSTEEQQYVVAATEFVRAALREESGALIGADEFRDEVEKYFPMPKNSPETIKAKEELRQRKIDELALQSGGAFEANRFLKTPSIENTEIDAFLDEY